MSRQKDMSSLYNFDNFDCRCIQTRPSPAYQKSGERAHKTTKAKSDTRKHTRDPRRKRGIETGRVGVGGLRQQTRLQLSMIGDNLNIATSTIVCSEYKQKDSQISSTIASKLSTFTFSPHNRLLPRVSRCPHLIGRNTPKCHPNSQVKRSI